MIDRSEINRALAKALAYQACGKPEASWMWAAELMRLLRAGHLLHPAAVEAALARAGEDIPAKWNNPLERRIEGAGYVRKLLERTP
jgi:hypothetical protein